MTLKSMLLGTEQSSEDQHSVTFALQVNQFDKSVHVMIARFVSLQSSSQLLIRLRKKDLNFRPTWYME